MNARALFDALFERDAAWDRKIKHLVYLPADKRGEFADDKPPYSLHELWSRVNADEDPGQPGR